MGISAEDKIKKNLYPRICRTCGIVFAGGPRAWYCPECRAKRKVIDKKAYNARKRAGKVREIGSKDVCERCGSEYIVSGGLQKYCKNCAAEVMQELDRLQGMEYYNKNKNKINPKRNGMRRVKKYCQRCGAEISASGGRMFCAECEREGKKEQNREKRFSRNIYKRGNSYIVFSVLDRKRIYIKCTTDEKEALRLRDLADEKKKTGVLKKWIEEIRSLGDN